MRKLFMSAACLALCAQSTIASADELNASHIDQQASWIAHLDLLGSENSKILQNLTDNKNANQQSRLSDWIAQRYGIRIDQLDGLTLYSTGGDQSVALLYGDIQEERLLDSVRSQADIDTQEIGDVRYHTWTVAREQSNRTDADQVVRSSATPDRFRQPASANRPNSPHIEQPTRDQQVTAAFLEDVAVFASGTEAAQQAVKAVRDDQGLDTEQLVKVQNNVDGKVLFQAVVLDVDKANRTAESYRIHNSKEGLWAVMNELDTISIAVGERDAKHAFVAVEAKAKSETAAEKVGDIVDGLRALASLSESNQPQGNLDLGALQPNVEQDGAFLRMGWTIDVDQLTNLLDRQMERVSTNHSIDAAAGRINPPTNLNR